MDELTKIKYKRIIIEILREFLDYCKRYDLRYFCCGGTAIGAIRHKGMIPWDDDIDILMPRPDYDRFLLHYEHTGNPAYELIFAERFPSYYLPFSKLCSKNTTVLEYKDIPCVLGASIDIFPLDGISSVAQVQREAMLKFRRAANKLLVIPKFPLENLRCAVKRFMMGQLRTAANELIYSIRKRKVREEVLQQLFDVMRQECYSRANTVANFGGMWGLKEISEKKWFEGFCEVEFEGMIVRIPKDYDAYLSKIYGDYMTLPPKEERISHHHFAYVNLEERKEIGEVLRLIEKGGKNA